MATTATKQQPSGPVLDWSAGHGPVTGALSATTGAFAVAATGAATAMPPGWALAVGAAGALGHTVAGLRVRNAGRTLYEEAREEEAIAAEQRAIARELSAERRAIAAEWVDRIQRVCSTTVRVVGVEI
ncbi:hypothetical protein GCM10022206_79500 [Streptomyces chiangmaiensis]